MQRGGVHDQLDHGFHRYSTDERWHLPHFEKMLYDQALIAVAAVETRLATGRERFGTMARQTLGYMTRRLGSPEGAFYCAEDADSEGVEGRFYVWTLEEVREVLGEDAELVIRAHGLTGEGNVVDEATGKRTGANVLGAGEPVSSIAEERGLPAKEVRSRVEAARERLLEARNRRTRPALDDKVLTDWNGLAIAALAVASRALGAPEYSRAATRAAGFLLDGMTEGDRLLHRYRDGDAGIPGHLDDYAFLAWGLLELHRTTQEPEWLERALALTETMLAHFSGEGGFYLSPDDGENLVARPRELYDGAAPAGTSVAVANLVRLARLTGEHRLEESAISAARAVAGTARLHPSGHTFLVSAVDLLLGPSAEVVVAGARDADETRAMLEKLNGEFLPRTSVLVSDEGDVARLAPWTSGIASEGDTPTAHVCRGGACGLPTTDVREMLRLVNEAESPEEDRT
jgi:hypothetical protein